MEGGVDGEGERVSRGRGHCDRVMVSRESALKSRLSRECVYGNESATGFALAVMRWGRWGIASLQ